VDKAVQWNVCLMPLSALKPAALLILRDLYNRPLSDRQRLPIRKIAESTGLGYRTIKRYLPMLRALKLISYHKSPLERRLYSFKVEDAAFFTIYGRGL
jgi:hypothetical protein